MSTISRGISYLDTENGGRLEIAEANNGGIVIEVEDKAFTIEAKDVERFVDDIRAVLKTSQEAFNNG